MFCIPACHVGTGLVRSVMALRTIGICRSGRGETGSACRQSAHLPRTAPGGPAVSGAAPRPGSGCRRPRALACALRTLAVALAAYGMAFLDLPATPPRSAFLDQLADLLVLREKHRDAQVSLRQTAAEVQDPALREEARHCVDQLGQQVTAFDGKIRELIASDPDTDQRYRILTSIPGVGPVSAAALCCWMPELGHLGNRQVAALLGVAPFARDSGRHHGARHIRGGRQRPRNVLYMAALTAAQHNPDLQRVFLRLKAAGKSHKVTIVAVMRKLIILANVLLRETRPWSETAPGARA